MIPALLLSAAALAAEAPAPPPPKPADAKLVERVQVVVVQLPLIATDSRGHPVTDLTASEIEVQQDGRKTGVAYLDRLHRSGVDAKDLPQVRLDIDAPGGWPQPESSTSGPPEYVLFFVDVRNDDPLERDKTTERLIAFARSGLRPWVRAAVMSFDGTTPRLDLPFTGDRAALATALAQARSRNGGPINNLQSDVRQLLQRLDGCVPSSGSGSLADPQCLRDVSREYIEEKRAGVEAFLAALIQTVQFVVALQGRKTVYALTHGVIVDPLVGVREAVRSVVTDISVLSGLDLYLGSGDTPELQMDRLIDLAARHRVALSFVDRTRPPSMDTGASSGRLMNPGTFPAGVAYAAAQDALREAAASTGGTFVATLDVREGLAKLRDLQEGGYELGYTLDHLPSKNQLSKVRVKSMRRGVHLTYGRGFDASATPQAISTLKGRIGFEKASGPRLAAAVAPRHGFTIQADPAALGYTERDLEMVATFTLDVIVEDELGRQLVQKHHLIEHAYPADVWRRGEAQPITIHGWVELPPGRFVLRAAFRNTASGQQGYVSQAITVQRTP